MDIQLKIWYIFFQFDLLLPHWYSSLKISLWMENLWSLRMDSHCNGRNIKNVCRNGRYRFLYLTGDDITDFVRGTADIDAFEENMI